MRRIALLVLLLVAGAGHAEDEVVLDKPLDYLGTFSNIRVEEDQHAFGSSIQFWREHERIFGLFTHTWGQTKDFPLGSIERFKFDPNSTDLTFRARLTLGRHNCKIHNDVPSQDLFEFKGKWKKTKIEGVLKFTDALHPGKGKSSKIILDKQPTEDPFSSNPYAPSDINSYEEWQTRVEEMLKFRGPKW